MRSGAVVQAVLTTLAGFLRSLKDTAEQVTDAEGLRAILARAFAKFTLAMAGAPALTSPQPGGIGHANRFSAFKVTESAFLRSQPSPALRLAASFGVDPTTSLSWSRTTARSCVRNPLQSVAMSRLMC